MTLLNDETAAELVGSVRAVRNAAHEAVGSQLRDKVRLRSSTKTRKSVQTRERIMGAASELMMERGGTNFQMSEVSERCHMSKGALYYYFADKDELIGAIFDEAVDDLVDGIEDVVVKTTSAREALTCLYAEFARRLRAGSPLAFALTHELAGTSELALPDVTTHFSRAIEIIADQFERAKSEGIVREDIDSHAAAVFATGGFLATSLVVAERRSGDDVSAITSALADMTLHGVGVTGVSLA